MLSLSSSITTGYIVTMHVKCHCMSCCQIPILCLRALNIQNTLYHIPLTAFAEDCTPTEGKCYPVSWSFIAMQPLNDHTFHWLYMMLIDKKVTTHFTFSLPSTLLALECLLGTRHLWDIKTSARISLQHTPQAWNKSLNGKPGNQVTHCWIEIALLVIVQIP